MDDVRKQGSRQRPVTTRTSPDGVEAPSGAVTVSTASDGAAAHVDDTAPVSDPTAAPDATAGPDSTAAPDATDSVTDQAVTDQGGVSPAPAESTPVRPARSESGGPAHPPKMYRRRGGRALAGVAGGLADHLGVQVLWVRAAFAVLAGLGGLGLVAYGLLWAFVPQQRRDEARGDLAGRERQQAYGLIALGVGFTVVGGVLSGVLTGWVGVPLAVVLVGAAVVWREADETQRRRWRDGARTGVAGAVFGGGGVSATIRVLSGVALVMVGIGVIVLRGSGLDQVQFALGAVLATLVGVALLTVPFWLRLVRDLGEERRARIRTEERAEIAAHLHDSVLQTLALIQKRSDRPREVARLARGQERELRTWLYGPSGYGAPRDRGAAASADPSGAASGGVSSDGVSTGGADAGDTLARSVATACGEVEDRFGISVQQVVVGDAEVDDRLVALVQAAREAIVNAAKHAGVDEVSVYAEVEPESVTVFVRDRGAGFDPDAVPADRHGLADSIRGRMDRVGGTYLLRTAPGEGTEVQLAIPRTGAADGGSGDRSTQGAAS